MLPRIGAAFVTAAALALPDAASAAEVSTGPYGTFAVGADLSACVTLSFARPTTGAGTLSAVGVASGPGTIVGVVRGATPIVLTGTRSWYGCVAGAYAGATVAEAVYAFSLTTTEYDVVDVTRCSVRTGVTSCA